MPDSIPEQIQQLQNKLAQLEARINALDNVKLEKRIAYLETRTPRLEGIELLDPRSPGFER